MIVLTRQECVEIGRYKGDADALTCRPRFTGMHVPWPEAKPHTSDKGKHKWATLRQNGKFLRVVIIVRDEIIHGAMAVSDGKFSAQDNAIDVAHSLLKMYNVTGHERAEYEELLMRLDSGHMTESAQKRLNQLMYSVWGGWADGPPPWTKEAQERKRS